MPALPSVRVLDSQKELAVQLESHATPPRETPQQRYANLHRALERGLDSDEVWKDLADVSVSLGHVDEAVRCLRRIRNETVRLALQSRLERLGLIPTEQSSSGAPAASDAGAAEHHGPEHRLTDHVVDAFQYLLHQHMPWLVLVTTLAFPAVIGVGGFLTAGGSWFLLAGLAALPGLCVLGLVGAMARQILLASAGGEGDVPPVPSFWLLVADARRFFIDLGLVFGSLVGPALIAAWLGTPWSTALPGLVVGAFFAPMAWSLRHLQGNFEALSPVRLVRAVARTGSSYAGVATIVMLLFVPAALTTFAAFGSPVWVQIAIVGPLSVLPLFVSARLLGTWIDSRRVQLGLRPKPTVNPEGVKAEPASPRQPKRPEALEHFRAPAARREPAQPAPAKVRARPVASRTPATPRPAAAPVAAKPAAAAPAPRAARPVSAGNEAPKTAAPKVAVSKAAAPKVAAPKAAAPVAPARPAAPAPRAIEGRAPAPLDAPDLRHMPGATVVSGKDRQRQGAAARRP
jgi:hypothetical protein